MKIIKNIICLYLNDKIHKNFFVKFFYRKIDYCI